VPDAGVTGGGDTEEDTDAEALPERLVRRRRRHRWTPEQDRALMHAYLAVRMVRGFDTQASAPRQQRRLRRGPGPGG
jgi:hypothetical protein